MSKKILTIVLVIAFALAMTLSLGGCGDKSKEGDKTDSMDVSVGGPDDENELPGYYEAGEWPDNEFTKQVPKPGFDLGSSNLDKNEFNTIFIDITMDEARKYGEQLKAAGFTENLDVYDTDNFADIVRDDPEFADLTDEEIADFLDDLDMEELGMSQLYVFEAGNSAGYSVRLFWGEDTMTTFKISKA